MQRESKLVFCTYQASLPGCHILSVPRNYYLLLRRALLVANCSEIADHRLVSLLTKTLVFGINVAMELKLQKWPSASACAPSKAAHFCLSLANGNLK